MRDSRRGFLFLPYMPVSRRQYSYMERIADYTHYGDELSTVAVAGARVNDTCPDLGLMHKPGFFPRLERLLKRVRRNRGKSLMREQATGICRAKPRVRANSRLSGQGNGGDTRTTLTSLAGIARGFP